MIGKNLADRLALTAADMLIIEGRPNDCLDLSLELLFFSAVHAYEISPTDLVFRVHFSML